MMSVEWISARAASAAVVTAADGPQDAYGQGVDAGNLGLWVGGVLIEGTPADLLALIGRMTSTLAVALDKEA